MKNINKKKLQECIKLMEKITGKKVMFKEYDENQYGQENTSEEDDIDTSDFDYDFENEEKSMVTAVLEFIQDYKFDFDDSLDFDNEEDNKEFIKKLRIQCLSDISKNFGINWKEVTNEDKKAISTAINNKLSENNG